MNRADFKKLAGRRLTEAKILLKNKKYLGAYYLAGYCVECSLKACIAKQTRKSEFPRDRKSLDYIYTHNLSKLVKGSGLEIALDKKIESSSNFERFWAIVDDWSEESRYTVAITRKMAEDLTEAISNPDDGVFKWIKKHW
jgi:HEPN domain-containing protein